MSARLLVPGDVPYEEWLARRADLSRDAITASEIAVLLGISPYNSPFNLFYEKTGDIPPQADNDAMSLGRHLEPWIADRWAEAHPGWGVDLGGLYASAERPWQMASPDRLLYDLPGEQGVGERVIPPDLRSLLEIKSSGTYDGWGEDGTDQIPAHYRAQVLWQLDVLGLGEAHVACLFLATRQIREYVVAYDVADVDLMRKAAVEFLAQVQRREPPPIDHHPATTSALKLLNPTVEDVEVDVGEKVAEDYRWARAAAASAGTDLDQAVNQLRAAMGAARVALDPDGGKVASRSMYERSGVDVAKLRAEHPQAYAACRTTTTVDKLTPARAKKDNS